MKSVLSDHNKRNIREPEILNIDVDTKGIFLFTITARTRNEKQLGGTDDEDLRVEIDGHKFSSLTNHQRYFDSPAAFSGGTSKGLTKTIHFILWMNTGSHHIALIPDISATFVSADIFQLSTDDKLAKFVFPAKVEAEDGDRRDWLTFVLLEASLESFTVDLVLKRRFLDSDDVKVIIDDAVMRQNHNNRQKLWYFVASLFTGENQSEKFNVAMPASTHYIELWSDRTPKLENIVFTNLSFRIPITIQEKIEYRAKQYGFEPKMILRLAKRESQFDPTATSYADAKGLFQLTDITVRQIKKLGFEIIDPYDIDQNIRGGFVYFNWLYGIYKGYKDEIKKTLAAWNWGLSNVPADQPLDFEGLPDETKKFIYDVLGDHDF